MCLRVIDILPVRRLVVINDAPYKDVADKARCLYPGKGNACIGRCGNRANLARCGNPRNRHVLLGNDSDVAQRHRRRDARKQDRGGSCDGHRSDLAGSRNPCDIDVSAGSDNHRSHFASARNPRNRDGCRTGDRGGADRTRGLNASKQYIGIARYCNGANRSGCLDARDRDVCFATDRDGAHGTGRLNARKTDVCRACDLNGPNSTGRFQARDRDICPGSNSDRADKAGGRDARKTDVCIASRRNGPNLARPRRKCREAFTPRIVAPAYARSIPPLESNDSIGHFRP